MSILNILSSMSSICEPELNRLNLHYNNKVIPDHRDIEGQIIL